MPFDVPLWVYFGVGGQEHLKNVLTFKNSHEVVERVLVLVGLLYNLAPFPLSENRAP